MSKALIITLLMCAAWLIAMLAINRLAAPAIYSAAGIPGVVITVLALLAIGKWLER